MTPPTTPPRQVLFDPTPEIFATDNQGTFTFPLTLDAEERVDTSKFDEIRFVFSIWHPADGKKIDLDKAYVELRANFDPEERHWIKLAEIEPVVSPYRGGDTFDGWLVLPVLSSSSSFQITGSGFDARARLQLRASAYLVS